MAQFAQPLVRGIMEYCTAWKRAVAVVNQEPRRLEILEERLNPYKIEMRGVNERSLSLLRKRLHCLTGV